ncbi:MAG: flagellar biosynthesis protein FlhA [Candidatus Tectomicrobia bacterium]|uniref:Flagellar biosynthesis protein FlhA n=1 Tax=Tectimicrobiota bacterium TaxID=2528274 RepID=A0A932CL59_UNCTE|nr:flagellar biosynthesis protein FlhA [Candidatus Tectomicrobia bacterium]
MNALLVQNNDLLLAGGIVGILAVMIVPMPAILLDFLLAFNITLSLAVLLVSIYTLKPLEFSVFPTLLLVTTLWPLSLNIATTRRILLYGAQGGDAAGRVIEAFGNFVVGGNYVVGVIVFAILVIINFVVITKGAGRIAEVAARFTLDAMPGKQMSIDADLNAGLINETAARQRRTAIAQEADFYGAMDGASKFVRGDAVAGILIMLVNILGGLVIGAAQQGLSIMEALQIYTLLTVGDGLVSQIPALIVSTAAGIIVSRAASGSDLGQDIARQVFVQPRAMGMAAAIIFTLGLIPGLPHLPFFALASLAGALAYSTRSLQEQEAAQLSEASAPASPPEHEEPEGVQPLDILELEVGYALIPLVDVQQNGDLLERIKKLRRQFASDLGIIMPPLHIRDNLQRKPGEYAILLKGVEVAKGELMMGYLLAMDPGGGQMKLEGIPTSEPAFGLPALWIEEKDKEKALFAGYTVVDPSTVVATHLAEVVKSHAHELLGRQEVHQRLTRLSETYPKVVEELVPGLLPLGGVVKVLQNLLREGVPIRDMLTILEALADHAPQTKDPDLLTEYVRQKLTRTITRLYQNAEGAIAVMTLDPSLESLLAQAIQAGEQGGALAMDPRQAQQILNSFSLATERFSVKDYSPVILTGPALRRHLKRLLEPFIPQLAFVSHNEIAAHVPLKNLGLVRLEDVH